MLGLLGGDVMVAEGAILSPVPLEVGPVPLCRVAGAPAGRLPADLGAFEQRAAADPIEMLDLPLDRGDP